jgi:hypothetical protein
LQVLFSGESGGVVTFLMLASYFYSKRDIPVDRPALINPSTVLLRLQRFILAVYLVDLFLRFHHLRE